jgi:hypothetical protein
MTMVAGDFASWGRLEGSKVFFKATGGSEIDNFFSYTRLLMVRLALLVGKMVMVRLMFTKFSGERVLVGCPSRSLLHFGFRGDKSYLKELYEEIS